MTHLFLLSMLILSLLSAAKDACADAPLATEIQRTLQQEELSGAVWATISPAGAAADAAGMSNAASGGFLSVASGAAGGHHAANGAGAAGQPLCPATGRRPDS